MKAIPSLLGGLLDAWDRHLRGESAQKGIPGKGTASGLQETCARVHTGGVQEELQQLGPRECHTERTRIAKVTNYNPVSSQSEFMLQMSLGTEVLGEVRSRGPWVRRGQCPLQKLGLWALAGGL